MANELLKQQKKLQELKDQNKMLLKGQELLLEMNNSVAPPPVSTPVIATNNISQKTDNTHVITGKTNTDGGYTAKIATEY